MWCQVIIILVLRREGRGSFVSRLEDVRIIYLWLTERKVSYSECMLFGTYDSQLLRSAQGQNFVTVSERCFQKKFSPLAGMWLQNIVRKENNMALSWQRQGDCSLHFSVSVLRSKRSALDLMHSQFSKLPPLPKSIQAFACTCISAAVHRIPKGGAVLCFWYWHHFDELIATEIFPDSSLLVQESY